MYEVTSHYSQPGEVSTTLKKLQTDELVYEESFYSKTGAPNNDISLKTIQGVLYEETTPLKSKSKEWNEQFYAEPDTPVPIVSDLLIKDYIHQYHPFIYLSKG